MVDRVGQQFGNYRLIRILGSGGFAEVYLGEHIHINTYAAIKVLHTSLTSEGIEKFRSEAIRLSRLEHHRIVRLIDFGIEDNVAFLIMEYAPHGSLRDRHGKGKTLPLNTIISYVKQIAEALQYAHDEKLIHRDIKPENMLLNRRDEVVLGDFGVAVLSRTTDSQSIQDITGTLAYMAPEQLQGKPGRASDQYSLGIMVYEWLSGDVPFHGGFIEIASQHMLVPPPSLCEKFPTLSSTIEQVVLKALEKDPQKRFSSVQEFAQALVTALEQGMKMEEGNTHYKAGRYKEAIADYDHAIALGLKTSDIYHNRGSAHFDLKDFPRAISDFDHSIELDPNSALVHYKRGNAYFALNEYQRAIADYNRALDLGLKNARIYYKRGSIYYNLKEYQLASDDFDRSLELDPNNADAHYQHGNASLDLSKYSQAVTDYTRAVDLGLKDAAVYYKRGTAYLNVNEYQRAITDYDHALALGSKNIDIYYKRGSAYLALNESPRAIADFDHAVSLGLKTADIYHRRGSAYLKLKEYPRAIADFDHALVLDARHAAVYYKRGSTYLDLKEYSRAITDLDQALALDAGNADAYNKRGTAYVNLKEHSRAIADFDRAVALGLKTPDCYYKRGATFFDLKEYSRAIADFDRTLALDPRITIAYWSRGESYRLLKDFRRAIADFGQAIQLNQQYIWAYVSRGQAHLALKEYQKAIDDFDHALALDASLSQVKIAREKAYRKLNPPLKSMFTKITGMARQTTQTRSQRQRALAEDWADAERLATATLEEEMRKQKQAWAQQQVERSLSELPTLTPEAAPQAFLPLSTSLLPCPNCQKSIQHGIARCPYCRVSLLAPTDTDFSSHKPSAKLPHPSADRPNGIENQPTREMVPRGPENGLSDPEKTHPALGRQGKNLNVGFTVVTRTNVGKKRKHKPNEDSLFAAQGARETGHAMQQVGLFVVADGMGGHANGQDASQTAIQSIINALLPRLAQSGELSGDAYKHLLIEGVQSANQAVHNLNLDQRADMGTTMTAALVVAPLGGTYDEDDTRPPTATAYIANVGDSRTYLYRKTRGLSKLTNDHSVVASLVEAGIIRPDDIYTHPKRNQIYRSLGEKPLVEVDSFVMPLEINDKLLLCSDGLWDMVRDPKIEEVLKSYEPDANMTGDMLIQAALDGGGEDNVSVIVVHIPDLSRQNAHLGIQLIDKPDPVQLPPM